MVDHALVAAVVPIEASGLRDAAVDAVRQWRFTPTLLNGEAVEVVMSVSVRFDDCPLTH